MREDVEGWGKRSLGRNKYFFLYATRQGSREIKAEITQIQIQRGDNDTLEILESSFASKESSKERDRRKGPSPAYTLVLVGLATMVSFSLPVWHSVELSFC